MTEEAPGGTPSQPQESPGISEGSQGGEHLDGIILPLEDEGDTPGAPLAGDGFVGLKVFQQGFDLTFTLFGQLTGLETLKLAPASEASRPASQAIYETCVEVPWLHWLIRPEGKWLQRAFTVGAFAVPLAVGVRVELAARGVPAVSPELKGGSPRQAPPIDGAELV